jgi:hypothetical protein
MNTRTVATVATVITMIVVAIIIANAITSIAIVSPIEVLDQHGNLVMTVHCNDNWNGNEVFEVKDTTTVNGQLVQLPTVIVIADICK